MDFHGIFFRRSSGNFFNDHHRSILRNKARLKIEFSTRDMTSIPWRCCKKNGHSWPPGCQSVVHCLRSGQIPISGWSHCRRVFNIYSVLLNPLYYLFMRSSHSFHAYITVSLWPFDIGPRRSSNNDNGDRFSVINSFDYISREFLLCISQYKNETWKLLNSCCRCQT